jgi:glucosamine--fructose-6-phosphate aminotransferase (isomerizing)
MIRNFCFHAIRQLRRWKIYAGVDPRRVAAPSLILFPLSKTILCCGLAGILTVKTTDGPGDFHEYESPSSLFERIRKRHIREILSGAIAADRYLDGKKTLADMEQAILDLKRDDVFERLFFDSDQTARMKAHSREMNGFLSEEEGFFEVHADRFTTGDLEIINSRLVQMKDITWALEKDVLDNVERICGLAGAEHPREVSTAAFGKYRKINFLLNCLDRLEVRGRDSAGIQLSFTLDRPEDLDDVLGRLREKGMHEDFTQRTVAGDLVNGSIRVAGDLPHLSFTYKTASIIGELGRNIRELRKTVAEDGIFREFASKSAVLETALAHTRWASVGSITEDNCHPVNNYTLDGHIKNYPAYGDGAWTISAALNGDVDNYPDLRRQIESGADLIAPEVTTDTKIIPLQIEKYLLQGCDLTEAFRRAVCDFEGSHAIAMVSNLEPSRIFLALKGSGQTIYVGMAPDRYLFSSELYGLVEETPLFIRMDGEKLSVPEDPGSAGQILVLDRNTPGGVSGIKSFYYNGLPLDWQPSDIRKAEITTRDIDRGDYPHFFLKEITESAHSVHKTLLGKYRIREEDGHRHVFFNLGAEIVPDRVRTALENDGIHRIVVIGHGTAAVAGTAVADALERHLRGARIRIEAKIASELSGFYLNELRQDTLVIPITQSGTTTDTNRAVAMAAERGAPVIAIVNRRQSDITGKSDGVFYTSDGRDIEMSVASTKAFYSQIVAGNILSLYFAQLMKTVSDDRIAEELRCLEQAPALMKRLLDRREELRKSAQNLAGRKKYWAVVGSGPNKVAADEIRIKLSELCYKTISSDVVENKKHIDLSAEPLIIACVSGNPEAVTGDIVKDVAIFKAHKAGVIVFADEGEDRFDAIADAVIPIPRAEMPLPVILNTVAGHLWGYYAACQIDEEALFFREFRNRLNQTITDSGKRQITFYEKIADRQFRSMIKDFTADLHRRLNGRGISVTDANTIPDIVLLLKYVVGKIPLEDFWQDFPDEVASPVDRLDICLGHAIDDLSRPIDAIRHQAKTVTVGTSRKEQPPEGMVFQLLKELNFSLRELTGRNIIAVRTIQKAVSAIRGYTLYAVNNLDPDGVPQDASTIAIVKRGGISLEMNSRVEQSRLLMGAKRTIVGTGHVYAGRGKSDGAPILIIPLLGEGPGVRNLLLVHILFNEALSLTEKIAVLGYRFNDIRNLINEYNLPWNDSYLESISLESLFSEPVEIIAGQIRMRLNG